MLTKSDKELKRDVETEWLLAFANLGKTPGKFAPPFKNPEKIKRKPNVTDPSILSRSMAFYPNSSLIEGGLGAMRPKRALTLEGEVRSLPFRDFEKLVAEKGSPAMRGFFRPDPDPIFVKLEEEERPIRLFSPSDRHSKREVIGEKGDLQDKAYHLLNWYWILINITLESIANKDKLNRDDIISEILNSPDPYTRPVVEIQEDNIVLSRQSRNVLFSAK